jgi:hypothetical protein
MSNTIDNLQLAQIVDDCAMFAIDENLSPSEQSRFGEAAELFRAHLIVLLDKTFDDGTAELVDANERIREVNASLKAMADQLADAAETLEQISDLVGVLDELAKIPLGMV